MLLVFLFVPPAVAIPPGTAASQLYLFNPQSILDNPEGHTVCADA